MTAVLAGTRPTILFCAEAVTLAHVARPLALGAGLDATRFDRVFACDERFRRFFPTGDWRCRTICSISSAQFLHALARGRPVYSLQDLRGYVDADVALLKDLQPALVVGDFRLSLSVSARLCGVPYVAISNAYWSPYATPRYTIPSHPLIGAVGLRLANALFRAFRPAAFALHSLPLNRLRKEFGLPTLGWSLQRAYTDADVTLYADAAEVVPLVDAPPNHQHIGPLSWSPEVPMPPELESAAAALPIVYVTLGSSGSAELLPTVLGALASLPCQVYASTAGAPIACAVPANSACYDYLPGQAMANRSSLVICNGGSPTTQQALLAGVPVVGIVDNLDQYLNMGYLERCGVGTSVRRDSISIAAVKDAAATVLYKPSFRLAALHIACAFQRYDAQAAFAHVVNQLVERKIGFS